MARKDQKAKVRLMTHEVKAYVDASTYLQSVVRNAVKFLDPAEFPTLPESARKLIHAQLVEALEPFEGED